MITIVVPTRPNIKNLIALINSFNKQSISFFVINIVIDKMLTKNEFKNIEQILREKLNKKKIKLNIFSNVNSSFIPKKNASASRNYGIQNADTKFILLLDDDIIVDKDYLEKNIKYYTKIKNETQQKWKDIILAGNLIYRKTGIIQNQWFKDYNYFFSRPKVNFLPKGKTQDSIRMYWWCGIFSKTKIFKDFLFDENIDFIIEDIDFTYRITKTYPMFITNNIWIYHMDREKTKLENAQIGNEFSAYRKGKNRIIFVTKNAKFFQKIAFYSIWLHLSNLWLTTKILLLWKKNKRKIIKSFYQWVWDWLKY